MDQDRESEKLKVNAGGRIAMVACIQSSEETTEFRNHERSTGAFPGEFSGATAGI